MILYCVPSYHLTFIRIIESLHELNAGAFSASTAAHKCESLTRTDRHIQPSQHLDVRPAGIREPAAFKFHFTFKIILYNITKNNRIKTKSHP